VSQRLRIVLGNRRIAKRTGTEIVTRDFALGLSRRGHDVAVVTSERGPFAEEIERHGVPVIVNPEEMRFQPDVLHLNQASVVMPLVSRFPGVPAVLQCHGPTEALGEVIKHPAIRRRFGVSNACCRLIEQAMERAGSSDGIFGNYADLSLFSPRAGLPEKPRRWLVVCEKKHGLRLLVKIGMVALLAGARLAAVGPRVRRRTSNLPAEAARHDLVFASARCALEAACAGAGVIVVDYRGMAGFLSADNCEKWWMENFGIELLTTSTSIAAIHGAVRSYDPVQASRATGFLRQHADLGAGLDRLESVYRDVIAEARAGK